MAAIGVKAVNEYNTFGYSEEVEPQAAAKRITLVASKRWEKHANTALERVQVGRSAFCRVSVENK